MMSIVALLFYGSAGLLFCASLQASFFVAFNIHRRMLVAFGLAAFFSGMYQLWSGIYYADETLGVSLFALRMQTSSACMAVVFLFWFAGDYTRFKYTLHCLPLAALWALVSIVLTFINPGTIRFSANVYISPIELSWGELIFPVAADIGRFSWMLHAGSIVFLLWIAYRALVLFSEKEWRRAILLAVFVVAQIFTGMFGSLVDRGEVDFFYIAGFSTLILLFLLGLSFVLDVREGRDKLSFVQKGLNASLETSSRLEEDNALLSRCFNQLPMGGQVIDKNHFVIRKNIAADSIVKYAVDVGDHVLHNMQQHSDVLKAAIERAFNDDVVDLDEMNFGTEEAPDWIKCRLYPVHNMHQNQDVDRVVIFSERYNTKHAVQKVIGKIAEAVSVDAEGNLFVRMLEQMRALFGAKAAFIAEALPLENPSRARIVVGKMGDDDLANIEYDLAGTPCEQVVGREMCVYPSGVQALFPNDHMLKEMGVDSYIGVPMYDGQGRARGLVVVMDSHAMHNITDKQAVLGIIASRAGAELQRISSELEISRLAYEDYVTRLPNRTRLHLELKKIFEEVDLESTAVHVFVLDLDFFNNINDALGHDLGDEVLRLLSERFTQGISAEDFVARFGGDEFIFIHYPDESKISSVQNFAARLIDLVAEPLKIGEHFLSLGASVGCAIVPQHAANELQILRCVELALKKAKSSGRNRYEVFSEDLVDESNQRFVMRTELKKAIENDQLDLYVQPQVDPEGVSIGAEALIRWHHPERGFMSPVDFIPIAEESGMIHAIGDWVLNRACEYVASWSAAGLSFGRLSVNISAWQLAHPDFESKLLAVTTQHNVSPKTLALEVTETSILREVNATVSVLERLRKLGFRVALDDFGTGYSSLAYLRDLPLDELKVDRSFVEVLDEPKSKALVSSMIAISRNMRLEVVAEGVETQDQQIILESLGCHYFQGFLYAKPMPEEQYRQWLTQGCTGS